MCCEGNQVLSEQTSELRKGKWKLFIAYKKGYNAEAVIHVNTFSSWLKKTILLAYQSSTEQDQQMVGVKTHQVQSMAASWGLHANHSIEDIMMACCWKSTNMFILFYCKDLQLICKQMYHLGPVVAAAQLC